jgi:hypothetical protein
MTEQRTLTRAGLKTPRAAAIAGMVFSVLLIVVFWLLRSAVPADPQEPGSWLNTDSGKIALALNLVPFAGIAFLWFIGVLRDRLGEHEDRFFATVFFGSGLLFLAMLFATAALAGALITSFAVAPAQLIGSATFNFARAAVYNLMNIYTVKTAGVFMITTSTIAIYTGFTPRWLAILGYALAPVLLFGSYHLTWGFAVFPLWVLLISIYIFLDNTVHGPGVSLKLFKYVPVGSCPGKPPVGRARPRRAEVMSIVRAAFPRKISAAANAVAALRCRYGASTTRSSGGSRPVGIWTPPEICRRLCRRLSPKERGWGGNHGVQLGRGDRPAGGCELGQQRRHSPQQIGGRLLCDFNSEICH